MTLRIVEFLPFETPRWCSIFNSVEYFLLHKSSNSIYLCFYLENNIVGACHFSEKEKGIWRSPIIGTFGSIDFNEKLDLTMKNEAIILLIDYFKNKNANQIILLSAPFSHNLHNSSTLFNILLNNGFSILNQDINHSINVDGLSLIEKMKRNNKKRIKKCDREGIVFEQVHSEDSIKEVYKIIKSNRDYKGFSISMSFEQIIEMYNRFPGEMYFFQSTFGYKGIAASICIKINPSILYVFYWGDIPGYEQLSPVVHIANGIYEFAKKNNFEIIDAGTSSINGIPNYGVATFKENLGFLVSQKLTYSHSF